MRNLKRALSLALASVMLLGMMVVGTSAASYPDVDENDSVEAIEVLQAVGVMLGDNYGNFNPDNAVTRNEMAAVMARLLLGTYAAESYTGTHPFTDVPAWADKYVAACYAAGIVNGTSKTTYSGSRTVTAIEAAAMMLRALGYEDLSKNAERWDQPVAAKANEINLFTGMNGSGTAKLNRNDVAKLSLNALESIMVDTRRTGSDIQIGDVSINAYINYNDRDNVPAWNYKAGTNDTKLQLCEYLYKGDLKKGTGSDDFGAPATRWAYKGKEVGKYADEPDLTYLKEVKSSDIYKDLGLSSAVGTANVKFVIDGVDENTLVNDTYTVANDTTTFLNAVDITMNGTYKDVKVGGKGAVTKVFYDANPNATDNIIVSITNYYLAKATEDYDAKDEGVNITVYDNNGAIVAVKNEDVPVANVKKDDYLVVTIADGSIKTVAPATVIENVPVTAARKNDYVIAGQKYEYSGVSAGNTYASQAVGKGLINDATAYDLKDTGYNLYLDPNGFVLGVEAYDGGVNMKNYLFVKEIGSGAFATDVVAKVVFSDGTSKTINVSKIDDADADVGTNFQPADENENHQAKQFYKFTTSGDGYKLTTVSGKVLQSSSIAGTALDATAPGQSIKPITGNGKQYADDHTLFLAKDKVSVGVKNAPKVAATDDNGNQNTIYFLYGNDAASGNVNRLLWVYATNTGSVTTTIEDLVYILDATYHVEKDTSGTVFYTYKVWKNGAETTLDANQENKGVGLYKVDTYSDGRANLKTAVAADLGEFVYATNVGGYTFENSVLAVSDKGSFYLKSDVRVYTIDKTTVKTVTPSALTDRLATTEGFSTIILVREKKDPDASIAVVYVVKP